MEEWLQLDLENNIEKEDAVFLYFYTPFCGTCQVAGRMLEIVSGMLPELNWGKCNLNYLPQYALEWKIESVPCLVILRNGSIAEKIYAFQSVPFLYDKIRTLTSANAN